MSYKLTSLLQDKKPTDIPPMWFMRQAGRYLPEYRKSRAVAGSFLDLCYNSDFACEVTLQPIRRYDLDASILFADILLIPHALGQNLTFQAGEGPVLKPALQDVDDFDYLIDGAIEKLNPIYDSVTKIRAALPPEIALIGFAGAPWTVATYMIAGQGIKDPAALRSFAYRNKNRFEKLIQILTDQTKLYLEKQIQAGANVIQLFDSWASGLPEEFLKQYCLGPCREIARFIKEKYPHIPVIVFPKGAGILLTDYAKEEYFDGIGIDTSVPWQWAADHLTPHAVVQGGLDPLLVVQGGDALRKDVKKLKAIFADKPYIFNMGHGFVPQTPPEHVTDMIRWMREES